MKVYIVTEGYYSSRDIRAVFSNKAQANAYKNLHSDREIYEFELDAVRIEDSKRVTVYYNYDLNCISEIYESDHSYGTDTIPPYRVHSFVACILLSGELLKDVAKYGESSKLLLKVMQDRFAEYKSTHMIDKPEKEETLIHAPLGDVINAMRMMAAMVNSRFTTGNTETIKTEEDTHD